MDQTAIACIEEAMHLGLTTDVAASLIIETDGPDEQTVKREAEAAGSICRENSARSVKVAQSEAERAGLWKARRSISPSLARKAPNKLGEDITVPRSAIPEVIQRLREISAKYGLPIVIFGHAGDGNLHPNILFDKRKHEEWEKVEPMVREIFGSRSCAMAELYPANMELAFSSARTSSRRWVRFQSTCSDASNRRSIH